MTNDLKSLCVLVTRPEPKGSELCKNISLHGGEAIYFPTIEFAAPYDLLAFELAVKALGEQDWVIFLSPQAVYASIPLIKKEWPTPPSQLKFAAVGKSTATALKQAGFEVNAFPENDWSSEGLLELPVFKTMIDQKVSIVRGEGGREYLEDTLIERGASVSHVIAYSRKLPSITVETYLHFIKENIIDSMVSTSFEGEQKVKVDIFFQWIKQHIINVVVCTSFEGVKNLKQLLGADCWPFLRAIPLMVISERIKVLAQDLGFQTIWVAQNASHHAIIEALAEKRNELCQKKQ